MTTQTKPVDESQALVKVLNEAMPELKRLAPKYVNLSRLMALALEARIKNPLLAKCNIASVVAFCKRCAECGTDRVGAGGMWPVPFWNKKTNSYDMIPIPDWRLLIEKAKKAKAIKHATVEAVYEKDVFSYERGLNPMLIHRPALLDRGNVRAVYCVYTLPDDVKDFVVMDWQGDVIPIRNRTTAWKSWINDKHSNPWVTDEVEQGKKTVAKRAMKLFEGASIELTQLLEADNVVMGYASLTPPEPITMPKAIETTATTEESGQQQQAGTKQEGATAEPKIVIPEGWIVGKDAKKKSIPHPHAGRAITEVPDNDLIVIMEGLRTDPKIAGKAKDEKYQPLLTAIEDELKQRSEKEKAGQQEGKKDDAPEQPQPTGSPLDQALAKIKTIVTVNLLLKLWTDYEKDIATWTGAEQSSFKMAFDSRMTEIKDLGKSGRML